MYTDYAGLLKTPQRQDEYLAIVSLREPKNLWEPSPFTWTNVSGDTWKTDYPLNADEVWHVAAVFWQGAELTFDTLTAGALDTNLTWYFNLSDARELYVRLGSSVDPNDELIQVGTLWAFVTNTPVNKRFVSYDFPTSVKNIIAENIIFDPIILKEGLGNINFKLTESAYYGLCLPDFNSIRLANVKRSVNDTVGRFNDVKDRFQIIDGTLWLFGGDAILPIEDHKYFGQFRIINGDLNSNSLDLEIASPFSYFSKEIPVNFYPTDQQNFQANVKGQYKPLFWGDELRLPTYRLNETTFSFSDPDLSPQDSEVSVYNGQLLISSGYVFTDGIVTFSSTQDDDAQIEVIVSRCVDMDGNSTDKQYAGAWLRRFLIDVVGIPEEQVPATSFEDFDAAFSYELIVYIEQGGGTVTCQEMINRFCKSTFSTLAFKNGIFVLNGFDPDDPPDSVANVVNDEILTDVILKQNRKEINATVTMQYGFLPTTGLYLQKTKTLNTADDQFAIADSPLVIDNSLLKNETDADKICVLYLCTVAIEKDDTSFSATGEVADSDAGDFIAVSKDVAPSSSGSWNGKRFKIREMDLNTSKRPETTIALTLEQEITAQMRDYIIAHIDDPPPTPVTTGISELFHTGLRSLEDDNSDSQSVNNTGNCVMMTFGYSTQDANPTVTPTLTWASLPPTKIVLTNGTANDPDSANSNKVFAGIAVWTGTDAVAGSQTASISFNHDVARMGWNVHIMQGVGSATTVHSVYQTTGHGFTMTTASSSGDWIQDMFLTQNAPPDNGMTQPSNQTTNMDSRLCYGSIDVCQQAEAIHVRSSYRVADTTSTSMSHGTTLSALSKKAMVTLRLQP